MKHLAIALLLAPTTARADMDIPVDKATAYSGNCQHDKHGGGKLDAKGQPLEGHTVEQQRDGYAVAAVPQQGSEAASIFGCEFTDEKNFPGVTFRATDRYKGGNGGGGTGGSDGLNRYDAHHECRSDINNLTKPASEIKVKGNCGGQRGGPSDAQIRI